MTRKLIEQQSSDGSVPGVHGVRMKPVESEKRRAPPNSNDRAIDIIEDSCLVVPISLNESHLVNNDDNVHPNDTEIEIEEEPLSLVPVPLNETHLASGGNDNGNDVPAEGSSSVSWIRRWLHYYIPNLCSDTAIVLGSLILKVMINSETDLGEMLLWFRLGNVRFYRLPCRYSLLIGQNSIGIGQPSYHYMTLPIQLNLQFGMAVEYGSKSVSLIFDNTQNSRDFLQRNGYYCFIGLRNCDFYLKSFRLWWNDRSERQSRLPRLPLAMLEE